MIGDKTIWWSDDRGICELRHPNGCTDVTMFQGRKRGTGTWVAIFGFSDPAQFCYLNREDVNFWEFDAIRCGDSRESA